MLVCWYAPQEPSKDSMYTSGLSGWYLFADPSECSHSVIKAKPAPAHNGSGAVVLLMLPRELYLTTRGKDPLGYPAYITENKLQVDDQHKEDEDGHPGEQLCHVGMLCILDAGTGPDTSALSLTARRPQASTSVPACSGPSCLCCNHR